jgi:5-formyltetrahydrofolate cyclo-ligase
MEPIDLIVSGSVAVNSNGARVRKEEGYSDLEFAILREYGLVDDGTTTVTTLHEMQFVDEEIPTTTQDVPIDWVFTPEKRIRTAAPNEKPAGIEWGNLSNERIGEIPVLKRLKPE